MMRHEMIARTLRMIAALTVVLALIAAGILSRSPWLIVLVTPALTVLYALGKFRQWQTAWRAGDTRSIAAAFITTLPVQLILATILYLLGLGLGRLIAPAPFVAFGVADLMGGGFLFLLWVALSLAIIRLEGAGPISARPAPGAASPASAYADDSLELDIDPTPLTPATFFKSPGYWRPDPARDAMEGRGKRVVKPDLMASDADLAAAEERTGFRLPDGLRHSTG
jgi:hypothetical protein